MFNLIGLKVNYVHPRVNIYVHPRVNIRKTKKNAQHFDFIEFLAVFKKHALYISIRHHLNKIEN